jgi:hypothetical protein
MARSNNNNKLKAFVRFSGDGRIVPSSLIVQAFKPAVGNYVEIDAKECCNYTTTTTSTTVAPTTTSTTTVAPTTTSTTTAAPSTTTTTTFNPVSDKRLKENIVPTGNFIGEFTEYTWNWNAIAKDLNLDHYPTIGVMAQDVLEKKPEAVVLDTNIGYFRVNYNMI